MVHKAQTLKCRAVAGTETKLACIKQTFFFYVPLDYFQNNFFERLAFVDEANGA
jgi:hypothetical protein